VCSAGHSHPKIVEAVQQAIATLDYAPAFQMGHPAAFEFAEQLIEYSGHKFGQVFYTNSGSEAVDTAMKMVLAYHRARGEAQRTRFIGRERAYHGVGFGGMSVGGLPANRKQFGPLLQAWIICVTLPCRKTVSAKACRNTARNWRTIWNA
jgi:beta-alanine--pyruvate transaminase